MSPQIPSGRERATLRVVGLAPRARRAPSLRLPDPALLIAIEAGVVQVSRAPPGAHGHRRSSWVVDRSSCLVVPAGARVGLAAQAPTRVAMVSFGAPLVAAVGREYRRLGVEVPRLVTWLGTFAQLPRTLWVHEIVHRYVFERYALGHENNQATRFLETEILKEVYFLFRDRDEGASRVAAGRRHSGPVERAVSYLELHLFDGAPVADLVKVAGVSESSLLRAFHREIGETPAAYRKNRVLDEAVALLRAGDHAVSEVARLVGYDSPTAFGFAFRRRFGKAPSTFVPRGAVRASP